MRISTCLLTLLTCCAGVQAASDASTPIPPDVFATVDQTVVTQREFSLALRAGMQRRFYHGKVPEEQLASFQREIGDELVDRALLHEEARRRGIRPDAPSVEAEVGRYDARAASDPKWPEHRDRVLSALRAQLEVRSMIELLAKEVQQPGSPSEEALRAFYEKNPDKFTEPEQIKVSAILLKVDPSAGTPAWNAAREEAARLVEKLRAGSDFGEMARLHSGDASAAKGGDMGYLHKGMLGTPAEAALAESAIGEITEPVTLLDGVAVFRLDDRTTPRINQYESVRERVVALWTRQERDAAWDRLIAHLRASATIRVNEAHYLPLAAGAAAH